MDECVCDPIYQVDDCNESLCSRFFWAIFALFIITLLWSSYIAIWKLLLLKWQRSSIEINVSHWVVFFIVVSNLIMIVRHLLVLFRKDLNKFAFSLLYTQSLGDKTERKGLVPTLVPRVKVMCLIADIFLEIVCIGIAVMEVFVSSRVASYLRILYGVITFVIALFFIIYGGRLVMAIRKFQNVKRDKLQWIFLWISVASFSLIFLTLFQLGTRFNKDDSTAGFVERHSVYYAVILINYIFSIASLGGVRPWKSSDSSKTSIKGEKASEKASHSDRTENPSLAASELELVSDRSSI